MLANTDIKPFLLQPPRGLWAIRHLYELLDLVEQSEFVYILEANTGDDPEFARSLKAQKPACARFYQGL